MEDSNGGITDQQTVIYDSWENANERVLYRICSMWFLSLITLNYDWVKVESLNLNFNHIYQMAIIIMNRFHTISVYAFSAQFRW